MNRKILTFITIVFCLFSQGCSSENAESIVDNNSFNLLIYFAADNNLNSNAYKCIDSLLVGYVPEDGSHLLYYIDSPSESNLYKVVKGSKGKVEKKLIKSYGNVNSVSKQQMAQVLADSRADEFKASKYGLILWSHGTNWLPEGSYGEDPEVIGTKALLKAGAPYNISGFKYNIYDPKYPQVKAFGADGNSEMELTDLKEALLPYHYYFIACDACLMGSVEVAYQLKDVCDFYISSPTEILSDSFPYQSITKAIFTKNGVPDLRSVCKMYYDMYAAKLVPYNSATISLVNCSMLSSLATVVRGIVDNHRDEIANLNVNNIQVFDRLAVSLMFDLGDFIEHIATPDEYSKFKTALSNAVVNAYTTDFFISIEIEKFSGLSTYIPNDTYIRINPTYKNLDWNKAVELIK